jgi:outer membrane lipase/esterase
MNPGHPTALRARRALGVLALLAAAVVVAACGGGTSQSEPFAPEQYVAFGDETSLILADGRRYTVNPIKALGGTIDCAADPLWTQAVASQFGFVFKECNPDGATVFKAQMRAAAGAKADDLKAQVDAQIAAGGFAAKSLVTVLVGGNDVLDLYARYPQQTEEQITAELRARGERIAAQVNRIVDLGARVIVSTVPDIGLSPYALQQKAAFTDTDRSALITRLVTALNGRIRVNILNDGRFVGLVLGDEAIQTIVKVPSAFSVTDATTAVCTAALPDCTTQTLVASGSSAAWLWADDRRLAYSGQSRLGSLAVGRAVGNPF